MGACTSSTQHTAAQNEQPTTAAAGVTSTSQAAEKSTTTPQPPTDKVTHPQASSPPEDASPAAPVAHSGASVTLLASSLQAGWHGVARDGDSPAASASASPPITARAAATTAAASRRPTTASRMRTDMSHEELMREADTLHASATSFAAAGASAPATARPVSARTRGDTAVVVMSTSPLLDELAEACAASGMEEEDIAGLVHETHDSHPDAEPENSPVKVTTNHDPIQPKQPSSRQPQPSASDVLPLSSAAQPDSCAADAVVADCCSGWLCPPERGLLRPCSRLVCVQCSQRVVHLDGRRWNTTAASYLFVRTHHPYLSKLAAATEPATPAHLHRAYACQCAAANVGGEAISGLDARSVDGTQLRWRCGGGHACEDIEQAEQQERTEQEQLRAHLQQGHESDRASAQLTCARPSETNWDDDDEDAIAPPQRVVSVFASMRGHSAGATPVVIDQRQRSGSSKRTMPANEVNPFSITSD